MSKKIIHIFGGGTITPVRSHLALCAPAFGNTARYIAETCKASGLEHVLHLTMMAGGNMISNDAVKSRLEKLIEDPSTGAIIFNVALCDFNGQIGEETSGFHAPRLSSREKAPVITLEPTEKLLSLVKSVRPDIYLVGFKTTAGSNTEKQVELATRQIEETGADFVFANDTVTRSNLAIINEDGEISYAGSCAPGTRESLLALMVDIVGTSIASSSLEEK